MQLIYQKAEEVVVFMGDGRGHRVNRSHLREPPVSAMTTLHGHERDMSLLTEFLSACRSRGSRRLRSSFSGAACAMSLISFFSDQETVEEGCVELMKLSQRDRCELFELFRAFVTCPWWSRIWVVQEIAVGSLVTIQYGTTTLPWEALVATAEVWSLPQARQLAINAGIEPENLKVFALFANQLTGLEQTRTKWRAEGGIDLVRLLQEFSDRQASDDRDKVYGILSLAKQGQRYIEPNYILDVFGTYRATALSLIGNGGSLACWAGDQKRKFNMGLPSWIPDWSTTVDTGDKRRMDLFDKYSANCGWTLRVIDGEKEYWTTVEYQMDLLVNSPAGKAARLPASLHPFVLDYIDLLEQRARSIREFDADKLTSSGMDHLVWEGHRVATLESIIGDLKWCELHEILPRCGISLLQRWIRDLEEHRATFHLDFYGTIYLPKISEPRYDPLDSGIRHHLRKLGDAIKNEDLDMERRIVDARYSICEIESLGIVSQGGARIQEK